MTPFLRGGSAHLASDRDDHDDAPAAHGGDDEVVDTSRPVAEGGDDSTEGATGTMSGNVDTLSPGNVDTLSPGNVDTGDVTVANTESSDIDTEGIIAEVWDPATGRPVTEETTGPLPAPDAGDPGAADPAAGDPGAGDPAAVDDVSSGTWTENGKARDDVIAPYLPDAEVAPPEWTDAEAAMPDVAGPDVAGPDVAGPDVAEYDVAEYDVAEYDVAEADAAAYLGPTADADDDTETVSEAEEAPPVEPPSPPSRRRTVVLLSVLSVLVVGAGVGGLIWSRSATKTATPKAQPAAPQTLPADLVTFTDAETGLSMGYPRGWTQSVAPVREVRLVVSDGRQYSASVRVIRTEQPTTPANLANIKAVTDGIVGVGVQILKQDPITVNDLIGFRYIYTFTDTQSGLTTAHLHYFLFQGHKMNSIVFEAVPSDSFSKMESTFLQMLASFHSDPEPP